MSEVLIPVVGLGRGLVQVKDSFDKLELQLVVVWSLIEAKLEDVLDEWLEDLGFWALAQKLWSEDVLELFDPLELLLLLLSLLLFAQLLIVLLVFVSLEEWKVSVDDVNQEVAEGDQIVPSALGQQVEGVLTGEDDVALEGSMLLHLDVVAVSVVVSLGKPKVDHSDLVQGSVVIRELSSVTNDNVVQLQIVVQEARLVDHLYGVKELDANLEGGLLGESLVSLEEVVLEGPSELVLDDV